MSLKAWTTGMIIPLTAALAVSAVPTASAVQAAVLRDKVVKPVLRDKVVKPVLRDKVVKPVIRKVIVRPIVLVNPFVQCAPFFGRDGLIRIPVHRGDRILQDPLFISCAAFLGLDPLHPDD